MYFQESILKKKKEESKEYNLTFLPSFRFASLSTSSSSLPSWPRKERYVDYDCLLSLLLYIYEYLLPYSTFLSLSFPNNTKESKDNSSHSNQNENPYDPYTDVVTDDETYSNIKCTSNTTTACTDSITKAPTIDNGSNDSPDWWWTEARHHDAELVKRAGVELVFAVLSVGGLAFGVTFFRKRVSFDFTLHIFFE